MSDDREGDGGELKYSVLITEGPRGSHAYLGGSVTVSARWELIDQGKDRTIKQATRRHQRTNGF